MNCIDQCLGERTNNIYNCTSPFSKHYILWRNDSAYSSYQDTKLCGDVWDELKMNEREKDRIDCESKCRPDCVNRYYNKLLRKINYEVQDNTTFIHLNHNNLHNQVTQNIPEISFTNFSGTIGGLVGVWLGFSIATVISDLMDVIRRNYLKNFNMPF